MFEAPDTDLPPPSAGGFTAPDTDADAPKTIGGLAENALSNAGRMINPLELAKGTGEQIKQGAFDLPVGATNTLANKIGEAVGGKKVENPEMNAAQETLFAPSMEKTAEGIGNSETVQHPVDWAYKNPLDAAALVASPLLALGGAREPVVPEGTPPPAPNPIAQRLASRTTSQALDLNPLSVRKLAAKAGTSAEEAALDLGNKATELIPNLVEPLDSANSKFTKVLNAHDDAGAQIGKIYKDVTKGTPSALPEAQEAIGALRKAADEYYQVDGGDLALAKTADRLEALDKAGKLDFDRLSKVKSDIGKGFGKTDPPPGTEDIYHILNQSAQNVVDRLAVDDPKLAPQLAHLKEVYATTSKLLPAMSRTAAREVAGNSVGGGLMSKVIPTALGGAIGGPAGAVLGGGAKLLQEAIAPDLGKNLAFMAMKKAPAVLNALKSAFPKLSATELAAIASRIEKKPQMAHGGMVPDDVKRYVGQKG